MILLTEDEPPSGRFNSELKETLDNITRDGSLYYSVNGHRNNNVTVSSREGHREVCSFSIGPEGELRGIYIGERGQKLVKKLKKYSGEVDIRKF